VRSLQRVPVHYRAALTLRGVAPEGAGAVAADGRAGQDADAATDAAMRCMSTAHACVTRDLHAEGALLHVTGGAPAATQVGSRGHVRIEIAAGDTVEFAVNVRHVAGQRVGVQFVG
jgi:hypothetical protein